MQASQAKYRHSSFISQGRSWDKATFPVMLSQSVDVRNIFWKYQTHKGDVVAISLFCDMYIGLASGSLETTFVSECICITFPEEMYRCMVQPATYMYTKCICSSTSCTSQHRITSFCILFVLEGPRIMAAIPVRLRGVVIWLEGPQVYESCLYKQTYTAFGNALHGQHRLTHSHVQAYSQWIERASTAPPSSVYMPLGALKASLKSCCRGGR